MLMNLRNALMAGKRLPYDTEVEYLESTGTQWIDTGIVVNSLTSPRLIVGIYVGNVGSNTYPVGGDGAGTDERFSIGVLTSRRIELRVGNYYNKQVAEGWYTVELDGNNGKCYVDGILEYTSSKYANLRNNTSHIYFGRNRDDTLRPGKISFLQIFDGNTLVRDFIPVRRGTVGYLYDRVSGKLFGNAGTGDFVLGPDVVPVEYIESHGTEWIDTGLRVTPTSKFSIDFVGNYGGNFAVCGASNGSAYNNGEIAIFWNVGKFDIIYPTGRNSSFADSIGSYVQGTRYSITYKSQQAIINGQTFQTPTWSNEYVADRSFFIGATNRGTADKYPGRGFYYGFKMWDDDVLHGSFLPVRVGTDATSWEGAMMDVLTRRIYRNAGTGAFGYGNDLKYPIPAS